MTAIAPLRASRAFVPALEGMRGLAALGVLVTHVSFQTGATTIPVLGRLFGRFDMAVAVFFGLSGFLLWRTHAEAARTSGPRPDPKVGNYLLHRAARILPAYWVVTLTVLLLLPKAGGSVRVWLSNLGLAQVFVPLTLTEGLTQMWSLSVEVAFYLVLPLIALGLSRLCGHLARWRLPALLGSALLSLGWAFVPITTPDAIHATNWLPGYLPWFAAGMVLAELAVQPPALAIRLGRHTSAWLVVAALAFGLAATDLAGDGGLARLAPWQYAAKIALGAVLGFSLLAPLVLGGGRHRLLRSRVASTIGRWSYGIFLWHLAVLAIVFPVFGVVPFHGHFVAMLLLTVLLTLPIAAASYALVEEPVRRAVRDRDRRGNAASPTATTATNAGS